jgi:glycosyltransferase involved in cell wall biosynthesis
MKNQSERPSPRTIVLLDPGVKDDKVIWGEKILAIAKAKYLQREFPDAKVFTCNSDDLAKIAAMRLDLLISTYTGPSPPWRVDSIAEIVSGTTLLEVNNHGNLLEEFARILVDGYITNSVRATKVLGRERPAAYIPLGIDDDTEPLSPAQRYIADVVFLGSGGRGNKRPETTRRYLDPAKKFDFALWGSYWDRDYWSDVYADNPEANDWYRFWRGPLPLNDITRLYSSAKIVLNYHEDSQRDWGMWNNRTYEALAAGAFVICDDAYGLREELGDGIVITSGGSETTRLIEHYLAHPDERHRIARIGRQIVKARYGYGRWARSLREFYFRLQSPKAEPASLRDDSSPISPTSPKFTVMMPVYERVIGLRAAIESVINQTYRDWELIIADDGSRSLEVLQLLEEYRDTPGIYVLNLPHRGQGAALNAAARMARGDYLCRLDSDDLFVQDALQIVSGYVARFPEVSYFYSSRLVMDESGNIVETNHKSVPFDTKLLIDRYIAHPLICWRRDAFTTVGGFREDIRWAEDYDLALRMAVDHKFQHMEEFLYKIRYHGGGRITTTLSSDEMRRAEETIRATSAAALREALRTRDQQRGE